MTESDLPWVFINLSGTNVFIRFMLTAMSGN